MMRIDAHQHFWKLSRGDYHWLTPSLAPIYCDFLPSDLLPYLQQNAIDGTIVVQAAPTDAETDYLLQLADQFDFIKAVVGWTDFNALNANQQIRQLAQHPKLKGMRPMIQDIPDIDWMLQPQLEPAFTAIIDCNLTFDALVLPKHLRNLETLCMRYPTMRVVIDHCAKPAIASGSFDDWAKDIAAFATLPQVFCKLSGLVTEAGKDWSHEQLQPFTDHILKIFSAKRIIWGSDWPVCTLAANYQQWLEVTEFLISDLSLDEQAAIMGQTAITAYNLQV